MLLQIGRLGFNNRIYLPSLYSHQKPAHVNNSSIRNTFDCNQRNLSVSFCWSSLTNPDCCQYPSSSRDVRTSGPQTTQLWRVWWDEDSLPFDCDVPGTVSATYGTLIVLAISFAIAATGIFLSLLNGIVYTDSIPGALLYYGLLSMRERRYGSSQYYPRYVLVVSWLCWE